MTKLKLRAGILVPGGLRVNSRVVVKKKGKGVKTTRDPKPEGCHEKCITTLPRLRGGGRLPKQGSLKSGA